MFRPVRTTRFKLATAGRNMKFTIFKFWKRKDVVMLVETVSESNLWIISNPTHTSWLEIDYKLKRRGGSSYKKFHQLLKKFANTEPSDNWRFYDLMMTHFPHYAKDAPQDSNLEIDKTDELMSLPQEEEEDPVISFFNQYPSCIPALMQKKRNDDVMLNDPDQVFVDEIYKDLKDLDDEAKSLFKIRAQEYMHLLKFKRHDPFFQK